MKQLIEGGRLLTAGRLEGSHADILIENDTIVAVLPPGESVGEDVRRVDAHNRIVMPGLVNAHTHATVNLAKGLQDRWSLELLLNAYPWTNGGRTTELKYLSTLIGATEMIRKGCTAAYDMAAEIPAPSVDGIEAVARGYADAGMRAVIAPMMADRTFYQAIPGLIEAMPEDLRRRVETFRANPYDASLATCRDAFERWSWDRDQIRPALGPTIPHHCTDEFLTACRQFADEFGIGIQMHVLESKVQGVVGMRRYGTTLVGHLHRLGLLSPSFTAAHAVWIDDDDMARLADTGASVAHNPGSNMKLGAGIAAMRRMRDRGIPVGIGTDGSASSDHLNVFEAMRLAALVSRVQGPEPLEWISAGEAFEAATAGGARALGLGDVIGRIEPGYKADMVFLDLGHIHYIPLNDPVLAVVFREDGTGIDRVMIGGRMVMENGKVSGIDMRKLAVEAEKAIEYLTEKNAAAKDMVFALEPVVHGYCVGLAREPYHVHRWCGHAH